MLTHTYNKSHQPSDNLGTQMIIVGSMTVVVLLLLGWLYVG
jgi:hypothetical protein